MNTPVQELMRYMEQNQYFIGNDLLEKYNELLGKEKEQIERAFEEGMFHHTNGLTPKEYYEETHNNVSL